MFKISRKSCAAVAIASGAFLSLPVAAQEATLKSHDGSLTMAVEVLSFDDETMRVSSDVGEFVIDRDAVSCEGPGCPPRQQDTLSAQGEDDTVTLTENGGSGELVGRLLEFTGTEYIVETAAGTYRARADSVMCSGAACPQPASKSEGSTAVAADDGSQAESASSSVVTLTTYVGSVEITGELLRFTGSEYVVLTPTGEFRLKADTVKCSGAGCSAPVTTETAALVEPVQQAAQPEPTEKPMVALTTNVGAIEIAGELLDFTGTEYIVLTPTGEYRLKADTVTCSGNACPAVSTQTATAQTAPTQTPTTQTATKTPNVQSTDQPAAETTVAAAEQRPQQDLSTAPTVTLTTNVGAIEITGKLLEYTGTEYVLFTPTGEYRLQAATVSCSGAACAPSEATPASVAVVEQEVAPEFEEFDPARADVRISGADAVGVGLLPSFWRGYADQRGFEQELVQLSDTKSLSRFIGGSGQAKELHYLEALNSARPFDALIDKSAEFGMASRVPNPREAAALRSAGAGDVMSPENNTVVAVESVAMIVHPSNPVNALSLDQIARIYRGEISNWAEVGGANAPILVLSRNDDSGTRDVFDQVVANGGRLREGPLTVYVRGGSSGMQNAVLASSNAIGYVAFAAAKEAKQLNISGSCGLTSVATPFSVKTEEYPLVRRHYLFSRADNMTSEAQSFLEYMRSPASEGSVAASDLVNFALEIEPEDVAQSRYSAVQNVRYNSEERGLARILENDLRTWNRLSTTFRFATGSSRLGTKELADIQRLTAYFGQQAAGTEIAVVGFADSVGDFTANLRLSNVRASLVASAIEAEGSQALNGIRLTTKAFSELAPAACNTDENGRRINRRVEIWIRSPR